MYTNFLLTALSFPDCAGLHSTVTVAPAMNEAVVKPIRDRYLPSCGPLDVPVLLLQFLLAAVLFPGPFSAWGQDISDKYPELIERVRQINIGNDHRIVTLENQEFMPQMTDGGGRLTGYYQKDHVERITREIVLSYGIETFDYYFTAGQLIFIYETLRGFRYNEVLGTYDYTKTNVNLNFIGRYYFRDNKLIDLETTGHNRFEDDSIDIEATLLKEMKGFQRQLDRKRSSNRR